MKCWIIGVLVFATIQGALFEGLNECPSNELYEEKIDKLLKECVCPINDSNESKAIKPFHGIPLVDTGYHSWNMNTKPFLPIFTTSHPYPESTATSPPSNSGSCQCHPPTQNKPNEGNQAKGCNTKVVYQSCVDAYKGSEGVHTLEFTIGVKAKVYCIPDKDRTQRPWTVILRRFGGNENFDRPLNDYEQGFGDIAKEHFLGLDLIHKFTYSRRHELWIHVANNDYVINARYDFFAIGNSKENYVLHTLGRQLENLGFDNFQTHTGNRFSTKNLDYTSANCSRKLSAGWWFYEDSKYPGHDCADTYLTAKRENDTFPEFTFHHFDVNGTMVEKAFMAIRPVD